MDVRNSVGAVTGAMRRANRPSLAYLPSSPLVPARRVSYTVASASQGRPSGRLACARALRPIKRRA